MSTTDQLAAVVNPTTTAPVAKPKTKAPIIVQQVLSDQFKKQLALAVPKHLNADRMARIAATEVRKNKALLNTEPTSFLGSVMQAAQLGLEPGSALGQAYLVPYGNQCQLIIGYKGMIDLARRSGQVLSLNAYAVREGDDFSFQLGLKPDIHHVPSLKADRIKKPITYVYAVATLKGGGYQFEVMSRAEVEAVRAKAKSKNIWNTYFEDMAKKTVIRRLFKYLPVSIEALEITNADAKREAGEKVEPDDVINIEAVSVEDFEDGEVISTQESAHEPQD
jgi:recombination protein RecT|nr:MAG TPA: RecT protein [Caudoviricetes sp.]